MAVDTLQAGLLDMRRVPLLVRVNPVRAYSVAQSQSPFSFVLAVSVLIFITKITEIYIKNWKLDDCINHSTHLETTSAALH